MGQAQQFKRGQRSCNSTKQRWLSRTQIEKRQGCPEGLCIKRGSKSPQNKKKKELNSPLAMIHPVQAKESGCMITTSTAHHIKGNLNLISTYYDKIFTRISGSPCWLTQRLQLAFVTVPLPNNNHCLCYNPNWEIPEYPTLLHHPCSHPKLSGKETLCACSCCHYRCPTHSPQYYNYSQ